MERKLCDSDFVSIPIKFLSSRDCQYERHRDNIDKIMMKCITDQIRRNSAEEISSPSSEDQITRITYKPPPGPQTLPTKRKFPNSVRLISRQDPLDSASPQFQQRRYQRPVDIPSIKDPPPPLPPKSALILGKVSGLSRSQSMPSRNPPGSLRPTVLKCSRENSVERGVRSRSQTPSKVTFKEDVKSREECSFDWVDFKANEGLPRGVILPQSCIGSEGSLESEDEEDDDSCYMTAEEEYECQTRRSLRMGSQVTQSGMDGSRDKIKSMIDQKTKWPQESPVKKLKENIEPKAVSGWHRTGRRLSEELVMNMAEARRKNFTVRSLTDSELSFLFEYVCNS